jgi:type IV pilus assembly protein PilA
MKFSRGFTLIELLVVIAIIGVLSTVVLAALSSGKTKGKDAGRITGVKALKTALELYYSDNYTYPQIPIGNGDIAMSDPTFTAALVPKYISAIPSVLITDGDHYYGVGTSGGTQQYGLYIFRSVGGFCKTGVSTGDLASNGWWGAIPVCNF